MSFVESPRFPDEISQGSSFGPAFRTRINMVSAGYEERLIKWTQQRCEGVVIMNNAGITEFEEMLDWIYAMQGAGYGFRYKDWGDYRSSRGDAAVAFDDQVIGTGDGATASFQLIKKYTKGLTYTRDIKKPVAGTVIGGIAGASSNQITVNTTTGVITFANNTVSVVAAVSESGGITRLQLSGTVSDGNSLLFSGFTGDWAGINGNRYTLTEDSGFYLINHDSSTYAGYSSNGGTGKSLPQSGETVTAGFEFDVPVRFDTDRMDAAFVDYKAFSFQLPIVEIKL